jgi:hypothetical protein
MPQQPSLALLPGEAADLVLGLPADIAEGADQEILEGCIALVEAPPQLPGERLDFVWCDLVEPFPGERALAHAADRDKAKDARAESRRRGIGDPIRQRVEFGLPSDQLAGLQQGIGMGDVGFGRRWNRGDSMQSRQLRRRRLAGLGRVEFLAESGQRFDDVAAKILGRFEEGGDPLLANPIFQRLQFVCAGSGFNVFEHDRMVFMNKEHQSWLPQFGRAIVLHLGERNIVAGRDRAIAVGKDTEIDICTLDHPQRRFDGIAIQRCEIFHHLARVESGPEASQANLFAMLREICARNHHDPALWHRRSARMCCQPMRPGCSFCGTTISRSKAQPTQVLHRLVAAEEVEEGAQRLAADAVEPRVAFEIRQPNGECCCAAPKPAI